MKDPRPQSNFKQLLNRLQEDSWQLELLVSGFAIFGLFYAFDAINQLSIDTYVEGNNFRTTMYQVASLSIVILLFNLILHVVLRSLWIGALGLRYVSGDIHISDLHYSPKFTRYLTKKVGSFDNYIETLEKLSSLMFAISFLLVFYLLSLVLVFLLFAFLVNKAFDSFPLSWDWVREISISLFVLGGLFTLIDFITLGMLKKNKWISAIYFPFYYVFSFFTLSFLYRPLFYNLIDNRFSRRFVIFLLPVYLGLTLLFNLDYVKSNYINSVSLRNTSAIVAQASNYVDMVESQKLVMGQVVIQSKIISEPYVQIRMPLSDNIEERVVAFDTTLVPQTDQRGYKFLPTIEFHATDRGFGIRSKRVSIDSTLRRYIAAINQLYTVKIDSISYLSDFIITKKEQRYMFEMCVGIKELPAGRHVLTIKQYEYEKFAPNFTEHFANIPFWYYP